MRQGYFLIILVLLCSINVQSQYFITGQDPGSTKWRQIKTQYFQVIYPDNYSEWAQYYINVLSLTGPVNNNDYKSKLRRLSVILHNQTTLSNAYAAIAPMRLDLFEMSGQNIYPQIWQDQLALHEYRHTIQQYKLRQGFTKGLYYVFGDQGVAFIMGLYLPFWFIEGDAVYAETVFSSSGRGRVPEFIYTLKAQVLDKRIYKYDKATFGSFRDFVPDHYTLGYQLMARGVEDHGIEMWDWTMNRVARRPYYIIPFTASLKNRTGKFKVQYYNHVLKELKQEWLIHDKPEIDTSLNFLSPKSKHFTNYLFPNELADKSIIVEKTGIDDINRFVRINSDDGKEKRIFTPGFDLYESLSVSGNKVVWNERTYDPRWDLRNYSVIKLFDIESGKVKKLTKKTRYFAPDISNNEQFISTVNVSEQSNYSLHILDSKTGEFLKEITTDENLFFTTPHWSNDDKNIVAIVLGKKGKSIVKIDTETWELKYLLPFSYKEIKWPIMYNDWMVYTGTYEGKDNLYALNLETNQNYRVFEARFGANYASFSKDGQSLYFSYYTADGNKLAKIDFNPGSFEKINLSKINYEYLVDRLVNPGTFNLDETSVPDSVYPDKKYKKAGHLFNLHSWAPVSIDADNFTVNPGATIMSQNKLSTAVTTLTYSYDVNEQTNKIDFGFDYYGWYPLIGINVDYGGRKGIHKTDSAEIINLKWRETNLSLTLSVPLNFTHSKWVQGIQPILGVDQKFLKMDKDVSLSFSENSFTAPFYRFYAYNQYKRSPKDIYPKWGQIIDVIYRDTPFSERVNSQAGLTGWVYFPGIIRHQGIRIYGGYQNTVTGNYGFSNFVAVPRGYTNVNLPEYVTIRSDYAFPIAYPDLNVPGAFYLKRIYSKVFYDYLQGNDSAGEIYDLSSTGIELYTDWHFLSILININLGVRVSHRFYDDTQKFEFLFGFSY